MTTRTTLGSASVPVSRARPSSAARVAAAVWAMVGVSLLFAEPTLRLGVRASRTIAAGLRPGEWVGLVVVAAALLYTEGHRALQKRLAPKVVARTLALGRQPSLGAVLLAPLYALSLVRAERRELGRSWLGVVLIAAAVMIVRALPAPWRGIVDGGVALALLWGLVSLWVQFVSALKEEFAG